MKRLFGYFMTICGLFLALIKPILEIVSNYQEVKDLQANFLPKFTEALQTGWPGNWPLYTMLIVGLLLLIDSYMPHLKHFGHSLKLSYDIDCFPDCCVPTKDRNSGQDFTFFRIKVDSQGERVIKNCQGCLISVDREVNGSWVKDPNYTEQLILAWAGEGKIPKDIRPPASAYLDVIVLGAQQEIALGTDKQSYPTSAQDLFDQPGRYKMRIAVSSDVPNTRSESIEIIMDRSGTPITQTRVYKA